MKLILLLLGVTAFAGRVHAQARDYYNVEQAMIFHALPVKYIACAELVHGRLKDCNVSISISDSSLLWGKDRYHMRSYGVTQGGLLFNCSRGWIFIEPVKPETNQGYRFKASLSMTKEDSHYYYLRPLDSFTQNKQK